MPKPNNHISPSTRPAAAKQNGGDQGLSFWTATIQQLRSQQEQAAASIDRTRAEKSQLSLAAMMGDAGAAAKLGELNGDLLRLANELEDLGSALAAAEVGLRKAEAVEAEAREAARGRQMVEITAVAIAEAAKFTAALQAAAAAASKAQHAVRQLTALATPHENADLQRLLRAGGAYRRTAQYCGLQDLLEIARYSGNPDHTGPLEKEYEAILARWVKPETVSA
jgi:hypothetical protein